MKKLIILLTLLFSVPYTAFCEQSIEKDKQLSDMGNSGASFRLGSRYLNGEGVEKNYQLAKHYLELAAEKKHAHALYDLGYMYLYGEGVQKDYLMAYDYFERATDFGFAPAYYIIGIMYYDGAGVKKNDKKAYEFCKKAIDNGYKTKSITLDHKNKRIIVN